MNKDKGLFITGLNSQITDGLRQSVGRVLNTLRSSYLSHMISSYWVGMRKMATGFSTGLQKHTDLHYTNSQTILANGVSYSNRHLKVEELWN